MTARSQRLTSIRRRRGCGPDAVYVGTIPGGLFVSKDGGSSFELTRPLWDHESRGGDLFGGEGMGAKSWTKVSRPEQGVHFGFPITAVVPGKSDMERIAVGGALVVARTTDGGATWQELRRGLPQELSFDVVYHHALANKAGAVAFGTTTGNLYVSDDGGEGWTTVANNLPPIYSVRFA